MKKSDAISLHAKSGNWHRFPVMVWEEGREFVTQVDGKVYRAANVFKLDSVLDSAGVPSPRNLYYVDEPDYEDHDLPANELLCGYAATVESDMTPIQMERDARDAEKHGQRMTLVKPRGQRMPKGFPRGELLCENHDGRNVYAYDPAKVLAWMERNSLLESQQSA